MKSSKQPDDTSENREHEMAREIQDLRNQRDELLQERESLIQDVTEQTKLLNQSWRQLEADRREQSEQRIKQPQPAKPVAAQQMPLVTSQPAVMPLSSVSAVQQFHKLRRSLRK